MNKRSILNDLLHVGPSKPLGYLPLGEVRDPEGVRGHLEKKGLQVIVLNQADSHVAGGAMVAYDKKALGKLLSSRKDVLLKNKWPVTPDEFVLYTMIHTAPFKTEMFDVIADAYADFNNPYRRDSKTPIKVATRYLRFGLLKANYSPLF